MARKRITENPIVVSSGAAAAAPVRRKPSTSTRAARAAASKASDPETAPAPAEPVAEVVSPAAPTYQEIANLAYSYWSARGYQGGSPEEDWLRAERELSAK